MTSSNCALASVSKRSSAGVEAGCGVRASGTYCDLDRRKADRDQRTMSGVDCGVNIGRLDAVVGDRPDPVAARVIDHQRALLGQGVEERHAQLTALELEEDEVGAD